MDSGTLSLSSAGLDKASEDKASPLSLVGAKASAADRTIVPIKSDTVLALEYHICFSHRHGEVRPA
jgi:hypothetical protein